MISASQQEERRQSQQSSILLIALESCEAEHRMKTIGLNHIADGLARVAPKHLKSWVNAGKLALGPGCFDVLHKAIDELVVEVFVSIIKKAGKAIIRRIWNSLTAVQKEMGIAFAKSLAAVPILILAAPIKFLFATPFGDAVTPFDPGNISHWL